jgi:phosphoribosyl 1,2-cyclic phosphodiesterase
MRSIKVKFWGVRGSIPTPGRSTLGYGGNTPCTTLSFKNGPFFILDAGTGIKELGKRLLKIKNRISAYIFISHFHWDHIQGLPFFRPAHISGNKFTILGSDDAALNLDQIISFQMDPTYFPIAIQDMKADIQFRSITEECFDIEGVVVKSMYLNHPGYALGYRITFDEKSIVYISDNEPFNMNGSNYLNDAHPRNEKNVEAMFDNFIENKNERLVRFCDSADILIHDTQFLPEEYRNKVTWGHSPFNFTVDLAIQSNVKRLILFHHDPDHDDKAIAKIQNLSRQMIRNADSSIECDAAQEGMVIHL